MLQRKCPKCESGIMSDMCTFQGWGKEGMYACNSCGHSKSIYEGNTIGPYIFFILFEVIIFFLEDNVSFIEYSIYGTILLILIYSLYKSQMRDSMINSNYPILGELKEEFIPNQNQIEALDNFKKEATSKGIMIKRTIAAFVAVLPSWLWFVKFKD